MSKTNKCAKKYLDKHGRVKAKKLLADLVLTCRKHGVTGGRIRELVCTEVDGSKQVCALGALGLLCYGDANRGYEAGHDLLPSSRKHDSDEIVAGNDTGARQTRLNRLGDNFVKAFGA